MTVNIPDNFWMHSRYICLKEILRIYPGHGDPFTDQVNKMLDESLENLRKSQIK